MVWYDSGGIGGSSSLHNISNIIRGEQIEKVIYSADKYKKLAEKLYKQNESIMERLKDK